MDIIDESTIPAFLDSHQLIFELENVGGYENIMHPIEVNEYKIRPQIDVPYDLQTEKNTQKSVDQGHSPWRLDILATTQTFVSLQLSPEGIEGDFPIQLEELKLVYSNDAEAIVEVNSKKTATTFVYLKRLIRQDSSGIWTVVGYDTKETENTR